MHGIPQKRATLKDIGLHLGLSARAVSQALSDGAGTVKVSSATKEKVQALAKEWGYRHNRAAKTLRTGKTGILGVLTFHSFSPMAVQRLHYALKSIKNWPEFTPLIYDSDSRDEESCIQACNAMLDAKADGVLILGPSPHFSHYMRLLEAGIPVTIVGQPYLPNVPKFVADKKAGFAELTTHLVEEGYKSITFLCRDISHEKSAYLSEWHVHRLREGFRAAAKKAQEAGLKTKFNFHYLVPKDMQTEISAFGEIHSTYTPGYLGMWQLIESGKVPDALMCQLDTWALGALRACGEAGISVPGDMAITGFEDDVASGVGLTPVTSVGQPHEELATMAVTELVGLIKNDIKLMDRLSTLKYQMVIRQSSLRRKLAPLFHEGDGSIIFEGKNIPV